MQQCRAEQDPLGLHAQEDACVLILSLLKFRRERLELSSSAQSLGNDSVLRRWLMGRGLNPCRALKKKKVVNNPFRTQNQESLAPSSAKPIPKQLQDKKMLDLNPRSLDSLAQLIFAFEASWSLCNRAADPGKLWGRVKMSTSERNV